jgi:hypothetical protein
MVRPLACTVVAALALACGCARSAYDQLARYKNEATQSDAELQECLDAYAGRTIHLGEGYGHRLPFSPEEAGRLLKRARNAAEELGGIEPPEAARDFARLKLDAAGLICEAFEALAGVTNEWEDRLPAGIPQADEVEIVELSPGEMERWLGEMARVDGAFGRAEAAFDDAALALAAAILRAHDENN